MKKIIPMLIAITLLSNVSKAQEELRIDYRERFMVGLKLGANYSNVYDTEGESFKTDPKFGLATGLFLSIPINKYVGLQPEILFSQKGFKANGRFLNNNYTLTRTTNYIDIPLLLSLKAGSLVTIVAGPQYSYLISQKNKFANGTTTIEQEKEFDNDNIRRNMFCFTAGIDITLKHIVIGSRVGLDMLENRGDGTSTTPRYKNNWLQASIGYRFYKN
ncbi:MAG TPA: porin family protein [Bacteroidia bacterium]|nr:porin family protein [Bacteroidia bacterium]